MQAALELVAEGRSFSSLGLREITRSAGVVPTSFYRHFRDTEALGLELVEESGLTLRRLLREARRQGMPGEDIIRHSVGIYVEYLHANRLHMLFIACERLSGPPAVRDAIRREVGHFADDMAQDLHELGLLTGLSGGALRMVCALAVSTMLNAAVEILDLAARGKAEEEELVAQLIDQLRVIFLGAGAWQ